MARQFVFMLLVFLLFWALGIWLLHLLVDAWFPVKQSFTPAEKAEVRELMRFHGVLWCYRCGEGWCSVRGGKRIVLWDISASR